MKVSLLNLGLASLAACATESQTLTAAYDNIETEPNFFGPLTPSGATVPKPYMKLKYSTSFDIVAIGADFLSNFDPPSPPNALIRPNLAIRVHSGSITKGSLLSSFTLKKLSFACAMNFLGSPEPLACTLSTVCTTTSGSGVAKTKTAVYAGGADFQVVNVGFTDLRSCGFVVQNATLETEPYEGNVTLLFDNLQYIPVLSSAGSN